MVVPSCYPALHDPEVYPQPDVFDPERWISGDAGEKSKNSLVFGTGPYNCLAQQYVQLTLAAMIGKAALEVDWVHHATKRSEEIKGFATLFPMVSFPAIISIGYRNGREVLILAGRLAHSYLPSDHRLRRRHL
jgi:C-22 sterol desaturase